MIHCKSSSKLKSLGQIFIGHLCCDCFAQIADHELLVSAPSAYTTSEPLARIYHTQSNGGFFIQVRQKSFHLWVCLNPQNLPMEDPSIPMLLPRPRTVANELRHPATAFLPPGSKYDSCKQQLQCSNSKRRNMSRSKRS